MSVKETERNFKAVLIFPPVWDTAMPYLSIPSLTAFLKKNNVNVTQIDANMRFWKYLKTAKELKEIYRRCKTRLGELKKKARPFSNDGLNLLVLERIADMNENQFVDCANNGSLEKEIIYYLQKKYSSFAVSSGKQIKPGIEKYPNILYHDKFYYELSFSYAAQDSENLLEIARNQKQNPFIPFYKREIIPLLNQNSPDLVGISVTALNQVVPAFTLAYLVKSQMKGSIVVMGGAWVTQLQDKIASITELFSHVDFFVVSEGEYSLLKLCNSMKQQRKKFSPEGIDNLIYMRSGTIRRSSVTQNIDLNTLPTPDFTDFPLTEYDEIGHIPLISSKGCYWSKCRFCSYPTIEPIYKVRAPELVIGDISSLKEIGARYIGFADPIISPTRINQISDQIIKSNIKIDWGGFARFENTFLNSILHKASKAGLVIIYWGLESASSKIQICINKKIDVNVAREILKIADKEQIHSRLMLMYGFPNETKEDFKKTYQFVKKTYKILGSVMICKYYPEHQTPMGLELLEKGKAEEIGDLGIGLRYDGPELESWKDLIDNMNDLILSIETKINVAHYERGNI